MRNRGRYESARDQLGICSSGLCSIKLVIIVNVEPRTGTMHSGGRAGNCTAHRERVVLIAAVRIVVLPPSRRESRLNHRLDEIRTERTESGQVENRMDHPLRVTRLFEIGKTESP